MLTLQAFQKGFFDRQALTSAKDRGARQVLSKFGRFVRTTARQSQKRRKGPSAPGRPPHAHSRNGLATLKAIFYAYEPESQGIVIGPVALARRSVTVPQITEHGGKDSRAKIIRRIRKPASPRQALGFRRAIESGRVLTEPPTFGRTVAKYPQRPFMQPAFDKELTTLPPLWRNSIK